MADEEAPQPLIEIPEPENTQEEEQVTENRGEIHILFDMDDQLQVVHSGVRPWKLWAAGKFLEMLGDQVFVNGQIEQMQRQQQEEQARQQIMQQLARQGGIRGPRQ